MVVVVMYVAGIIIIIKGGGTYHCHMSLPVVGGEISNFFKKEWRGDTPSPCPSIVISTAIAALFLLRLVVVVAGGGSCCCHRS
jgi:hypothetical protein